MNAVAYSPCAQEDALARYNQYFRTQQAGSPGLVSMAQAIRYQVYCLERKFENAAEHQDGLECDEFDRLAVHSLLFHCPSGQAIGTARLILPGDNDSGVLPIRKLLREAGLRGRDHFPIETTAEVSRFAISNQFRRRGGDEGVAITAPECRSNLPCLGLIQELLRQSLECGLTHWAAVMEPKLLRMLAVMGIHFTSVGPLVVHHGLRQPSYCDLSEMLQRLRREHFDHWLVVTDGGLLTAENGTAEERQAA
jgi:N-acyl amino acid synthase of PEP-CTERM/exosortase system